MKQFLEYRPHLEYKRKLEAILEEQEEITESPIHPPVEEPEEDFIERESTPEYTPSESLVDVVERTPTDLLVGIFRAKEEISKLKEKIIDKLKDTLTKGPLIEEYIKAREQNDMDAVYDFEDLNSQDIEGSTEAEMLPILHHFEKDLKVIEDTVLPVVFNPDSTTNDISLSNSTESPDSSTIYEDLIHKQKQIPTLNEAIKQIEMLHQKEEEEIKRLVELDKNSELDINHLNDSNHFRYFVDKQLHNMLNTVEDFNGIVDETDTWYPDGMHLIEERMKNHQDIVPKLIRVGRMRFGYYSKLVSDAEQRMRRTMDSLYKRDLMLEVLQAQKHKAEAMEMLSWVEKLNPESEDDPMNLFLFDIIKGIEDARDQHNALVQDLYRISELEEMQLSDYSSSLGGKAMTRRLYSTIRK